MIFRLNNIGYEVLTKIGYHSFIKIEVVSKRQIAFESPAWWRDFTSIY